VADGINKADVERVERTAGRAGRIMLWHRNDVDDGVAVVHGGAADRTIPLCTATAREYEQQGKNRGKQNSGSHRISSVLSWAGRAILPMLQDRNTSAGRIV
jgi:hypothetical protein